jgi:hypothetical protein
MAEHAAPRWEGDTTQPVVQVGMHKGSMRPNFYNEDNAYNPETGNYDRSLVRGHGDTLFSSEPSEITSAFADPSMRAAVPTVMGLALNEARKIGTGLTYSSSLSRHSSNISQRALKAGLVQVNPSHPTAGRSNDISFTPQRINVSDIGENSGYEMATKEQLGAARQIIRTMLRPGGKKVEETPQTEWIKRYDAGEESSGPGKGQLSLRLGAQFGKNYQPLKQMEMFKGKDYEVKLPEQVVQEAGEWKPEMGRYGEPSGWATRDVTTTVGKSTSTREEYSSNWPKQLSLHGHAIREAQDDWEYSGRQRAALSAHAETWNTALRPQRVASDVPVETAQMRTAQASQESLRQAEIEGITDQIFGSPRRPTAADRHASIRPRNRG